MNKSKLYFLLMMQLLLAQMETKSVHRKKTLRPTVLMIPVGKQAANNLVIVKISLHVDVQGCSL